MRLDALALVRMLTGTLAGNFVAPLTFRTQDAPVYAPGLATVVATSIAVVALSMVYRFVCLRDNRKRDETGTLEAFDHAYEDDLTDKTVSDPPVRLQKSSTSKYETDLTSLPHRTRSFGIRCRCTGMR
jgi:hypothetical protein